MPFKNATEMSGETLPIIANIWGLQKTGKSRFALSFPRPLYYFNFDRGLHELLLREPDLREGLLYESYGFGAEPSLEDAESELQRFVDDWREANTRASASGGSVVLDTAAHLKEMVQFVKLTQRMEKRIKLAEAAAKKKGDTFDPDFVLQQRFDYGPANQLMTAILTLPAIAGSNAAFIWRAREQYSGNGQAMGVYIADMFKDAPYIAQMTLQKQRVGRGKAITFQTVVDDNRFDPTTNGETFPSDVLSGYADLSMLTGA